MAQENSVKLIGNLGSEAKIIEQDGKTFATVSIATTGSYTEDNGKTWHKKETIWHSTIAFNPFVQEKLKKLKTGTRVEITGRLSYRPFKTILEDGLSITKMEATVIMETIDLKPLVKRQS